MRGTVSEEYRPRGIKDEVDEHGFQMQHVVQVGTAAGCALLASRPQCWVCVRLGGSAFWHEDCMHAGILCYPCAIVQGLTGEPLLLQPCAGACGLPHRCPSHHHAGKLPLRHVACCSGGCALRHWLKLCAALLLCNPPTPARPAQPTLNPPQGFCVFHRNRLVKPFWRVYSSSTVGRGVIGLLEVDFVAPTPDKQDFERRFACVQYVRCNIQRAWYMLPQPVHASACCAKTLHGSINASGACMAVQTAA